MTFDEARELFRSVIAGPINPETVAVAAGCVACCANDDEVAHSMEDKLHRAVLRAVADGCAAHDAKYSAEIALKTTKLDFCRWCA